jgi:hypothetical protein
MGLYITAGIILVVGGLILWLYRAGKSAGTDSVARDVAENTVDTQQRMDEAGAEARSEDVVDRLRRGGF